MSHLDLLQKTNEEQAYIALSTTNADILDILANSDSALVKMSVLANPYVSEDTIKRKVDDENPSVWKRATELLDERKN